MSKYPHQQKLIETFRQQVPSSQSPSDVMADILQISKDGAYRRLRGETELSYDEAVTLSRHFRISVDAVSGGDTQGPASVTFNYNILGNDEQSFESYLKGILTDLKRLNSMEDSKVIYAANDIPIFHYFHFKELTAFKLFYWNKAVLHAPAFEDKLFSTKHIRPELMEYTSQILTEYAKVSSVEIWTDDTINIVLKQIDFYWEAGLFESKDDALLIIDQVSQMLDLLQKEAKAEAKLINGQRLSNKDNNFVLYNSEVTIGNNCVFLQLNQLKMVYLSFLTFNSIITSQNNFCNENEVWLNNLIKKSVLLSGVSEKQRYKFFRKNQERVNKLRALVMQG